MNKKKDISGLIFSAFLVIAYVICSYFFVGIIQDSTKTNETVKAILTAAVFAVFGLVLFYATRVGDGKQIKRFSAATLIILDLPALYIILASVAPGLPFPMTLEGHNEIVLLASIALGYGIPYTFLSGYEQDIPKAAEPEVPESYEPDELDDIENKDETPDSEEVKEDITGTAELSDDEEKTIGNSEDDE